MTKLNEVRLHAKPADCDVCMDVPADQARRKQWGEASGYRQELQQRNRQIAEEFRNGTSMEALAEKYFLSVYAIRKIIYQK